VTTRWAASWIGSSNVDAVNDVTSHAGGPTHTSGTGGAIAGDVIAAQAQPFVQATGQSVSLMANAFNQTENTHDLPSGGPITTNGAGGALSDDIIGAGRAEDDELQVGLVEVVGGHLLPGHRGIGEPAHVDHPRRQERLGFATPGRR
jgi:hypothetical protein